MARCTADYKHKVSIENLTGTADAHGHIDATDSDNWTEYTAAYAAVQSKGGREFWKVDQVNADVSHVWFCPWSKTLAAATPDMRLIHESTTYEILSVVDIDLDNMEIEIQTKRKVQ